jgi:predicted glycosyltransferase
MRILVDIVHPADVNFYRTALYELKKNGHEVFLTVLERGRLLDFVHEEYQDFPIIPLGSHKSGKFNKVVGLVEREWGFISVFFKHKIDRVTSFGFYPAIAAKLFRIPSVLFHDDFEYGAVFSLCKRFGDKFIIPSAISISGDNIIKYNGFKELAYLNDFKPNKDILYEYGIEENNYIFVREVANISLNYEDLIDEDYSEIFEYLLKEKIQIIYFPENKENISKYSKFVKILKTPCADFHSLLYFSLFCVSSGDTVAREAALLGTPVLYTGKRKMSVNLPLVELGSIIEIDDFSTINSQLEIVLQKGFKNKIRSKVLNKRSEYENISEVIVKEILSE